MYLLNRKFRESTRKNVSYWIRKLTGNGKKWRDKKWLNMMKDSEKNSKKNIPKE